MRQVRRASRAQDDRTRDGWMNIGPETVMRQTALCLGLGLLAILVSPPARAEYVVIAASDAPAAYGAGTEIDDDQRIDLAEGARLTLIARSGRIVTIDGAFSGSVPGSAQVAPSETSSTGWDALKRLVGSAEASSTVLGAARAGAGEIPPPPGVWDLSVDSSGPRCVRKGELVLWRKQAGDTLQVSARSAAGRHDGLAWTAGDHRLVLPVDMAMEDGRMVVSVGGELRDFELSVLPDGLAAAPVGEVLSWLSERDCRRQALALIAHLHGGGTTD